MKYDRVHLTRLLKEKNELVKMIDLLLADGYELSNGSQNKELILYFLVNNGYVKLFKEIKFLFWKRKKAITISENY